MASTPGSGINKNLLTPCRRVGLSRKRKTPNSIVKMSSDDLNSSTASIASINDSPVIDTTPVNYRKSFSRRKPDSFKKFHSSSSPLATLPTDFGSEMQLKTELETSQVYSVNDKSKKELFERFASEDLFDSNKNDSPKHIVTETLKKCFKDDPIEKLKKTFSADESMNTKDSVNKNRGSPLSCSLEVIKTGISRKSIRRLSDDDFLSSQNVSVKNDKSKKPKEISSFDVENEVVIDDSDEDFRIIDKYDFKGKQRKMKEASQCIKKTKRYKRTLSIIKSLSFTDDELDTDTSKKVITNENVKECQIQIQRLSEDNIYLGATNSNNNDKASEKTVKKSNVVVDDDDAFTFTPEQEKIEKKNLIEKIKLLENQTRQKQLKLANLKRASIYKNKHDVQGLKQLTSQWINGCVMGLNDLLGQLQAHGPMSMKTLINNLHISSEMVAKLPLNID